MRSLRTLIFCSLISCALSLSFGSCSAGSGSSAPPPEPIDASIREVSLPKTIQGDTSIAFKLAAAEETTLALVVAVSLDGGSSWRPARTREDLSALAASRDGVEHRMTWDSLSDAGFRNVAELRVRMTPAKGARRGDAQSVKLPSPENRSLALERVSKYMVHYGAVTEAVVRQAEAHDLVVVHPHVGRIPVSTIRDIQDGVDPKDPADDVIVLAYISIGEDLRTIGVTDEDMLRDPRFVGDGTGPRIDPRGPNADGQSAKGVDPLGAPSNGGTGYASWYLDDNDVDRSATDTGDGKPDRNAHFGGCFVNAGDPKWYEVLDTMSFDGPDAIPGMRELLTADYGRGYNCDGLFLDTVDTCAPNAYTDASSPNQSEYEWTAPGFTAFMKRLDRDYPKRLVLQNRGLFYFDPRHPHFSVNPRPWIDLVMFESYRLNSNTSETYNPWFYADNKHNLTPKLLAEANRPDGFRVVSLGYAEGPAGKMSPQTLVGASSDGYDDLLEDIRDARSFGFLHYLTNAQIDLPNSFAGDHDIVDREAPRWTSTFNYRNRNFPVEPEAPTPRVGIQELRTGPNCATVRWDVAVDAHPVRFRLYYQDASFDFDADPDLAKAKSVEIHNEPASNYANVGASIYPNEATVQGLASGTRYWFCIRARDALGNEEKNRQVLSATPIGLTTITIDGDTSDWANVPRAHTDPADVATSAGPDWLEIRYANDRDKLYLRFTSEHAFNLDGTPSSNWSRTLIFFDCDNDSATGYAPTTTIGSELLYAGGSLYRQRAGIYNDGFLEVASTAPTTQVTDCEIAIPLARIFAIAPDAERIRLLFLNDDAFDYAPNWGTIEVRLVRP